VAKVTLTSKLNAMKSALPLVTLAVLFASCTAAYKSGQTPDDVYYSPARPQDEYVHQQKKDDRQYRYDEEAYRDDRYLRMKIRDRRYAGLFDDYYSYNPYYYHYYNGSLVYNSPWSSYTYWDYYYNPYCSHGVVIPSGKPVVHRPRTFDLSVYNPQPTGTFNPKGPRNYSYPANSSSNTENYRGSGSNAGNFLRNVFSGSGNSNSSSSSSSTPAPPRSSSGSSSSSSSGSSGSTNAPARKF